MNQIHHLIPASSHQRSAIQLQGAGKSDCEVGPGFTGQGPVRAQGDVELKVLPMANGK